VGRISLSHKILNQRLIEIEGRNAFVGLTLLSTVMLSSCGHDVHDHPEIVSGKELFEYHCAGCHQKSGTGKFLKGVPANRDTALSISLIEHKITKGDDGDRKMPVFPDMSENEAAKISLHLKGM